MSANKYLELCRRLEGDLANRRFGAKLPPNRKLGALYGVGASTVKLALKPLIRRHWLIPSPHGTAIDYQTFQSRPEQIGIVMSPAAQRFAEGGNDIVFNSLADRVAAAGFHMRILNDPVMADRSSLLGMIFLYSSFAPEFYALLHEEEMPFVAANRCDADLGSRWVDWDCARCMDDVLGMLVADGCRDVVACIPRAPNRPLLMADFRMLKRQYALAAAPEDHWEAPAGEADGGIGAFAALLLRRRKFPDGICCIADKVARDLAEILRAEGKEPHRDYRLYYTLRSGRASEDSTARHDCEVLAATVWKRLMQLVYDPWSAPAAGALIKSHLSPVALD